MNLKNRVTDDDLLVMWDNWSYKRRGYPSYDLWLSQYEDVLEKNRDSEILDLGCGIGADTAYLLENGYQVLSCDISTESLKNIKDQFPRSKTLCFDMRMTFPFKDSSYNLVIADLCLHYFCEEDTYHIMNEIKRILTPNGILLARVARTDDYDYGAGMGEVMEKNYYFEGDYYKRFFDEKDVEHFFNMIGSVTYKKTSMTRQEKDYQKVKKLFEVKATNEK